MAERAVAPLTERAIWDADLDRRAIAVVRGLAMDAPHAARSGHQGTAMALAPVAHVLWTRVMRYDASAPTWADRDRFVLSAGHASILQYALLYLTGHGLTIDDLRDFRQLGSRTPGHPEAGHTPGVEVTTGPLGQGFANGVGMAIAERWLRHRHGAGLVDHHVFAICSDGDLSEGVSHEAASLAGHQRLGRLVYVYDDNRITIDGPTDLALSDDAVGRFRAYGWHVIDVGEGSEDLDELERAIREAIAVEDAPSLVVVRSHVGFPSPDLTDDPAAHGYALFDAEIARTKELLGLPVEEPFHVPDDVLRAYRAAGVRSSAEREDWQRRFDATDGGEAVLTGRPAEGWASALPRWEPGDRVATRKASGSCLAAMVDRVPGLIAGGADLTGNTGTALPDAAVLSAQHPDGRQLYFGVREHAMGATMTGMALHGGVVPVGGTFLVFSDYMRPAIRLAALSGAPVVYAFTHDSVGVGEDGPTHQPVEQVMSLRAIPGLTVVRPADANETAQAWEVAVSVGGPVAMILSRQDLPVLDGTDEGEVARGAYILRDVVDPEIVLVGTGSEVAVCCDAAVVLADHGVRVRVVSMPSWELFRDEDDDYVEWVLPTELPVLSVEAGVTLGWSEWADAAVGIDRFGASAPGDVVMAELGITVDNVVEAAYELLDDEG